MKLFVWFLFYTAFYFYWLLIAFSNQLLCFKCAFVTLLKITCVLTYISLRFTCVSYAEARNRYRLDDRPSVCLSVCLSVRPTVTRWYCIKTAEYIVMLSSPNDSPFILVLCISRSSRNSDGVTPCGALNTGGV